MIKSYEFPYNSDNTNGIFHFLRNSKKLPLLENVIISNSSAFPNNLCYFPFGIDNENFTKSWHSKDDEGSWLMVQFLRLKVRIDSYATKSWTTTFAKSWILEGTNSKGLNWETVSLIEGRTTIPSNGMFYEETTNKKYFSQFRIKMIGTRQNNNKAKSFELFLLELFGGFQLTKSRITCVRCVRNNMLFFVLSVIIFS